MRAKEYQLLADCIERGLEAGYARAHKHNDCPTPADIWDQQHRYIMSEINEWFDFDEVTHEMEVWQK